MGEEAGKMPAGPHDALQIARQIFLTRMVQRHVRRAAGVSPRRNSPPRRISALRRAYPPALGEYPHDAGDPGLAPAGQDLQPFSGFAYRGHAITKLLDSPGR